MPTLNVSLTDHFNELITSGIEAGRYRNASEAVRAGLSLLEQQEKEQQAKLEQLRSAVQVGIDELERGEGIHFASMDELANYVHSIGEEVSGEIATERGRG